MPLRDALRAAEEAGLDLVEISPNANPPVAKVIDWGKYQYQKMKDQQRNGRSAKSGDLKQMRFGLKRSEEHTSELQSHAYLVCRLLLEKKKMQ